MPRTELLGDRNGKAIAHPHAETNDHEIHGTRGAHRSQRIHTQIMPDNDRIDHTVKLLEKQAEQKRHRKSQYQPHGAAFCHIFFHKYNHIPFSVYKVE